MVLAAGVSTQPAGIGNALSSSFSPFMTTTMWFSVESMEIQLWTQVIGRTEVVLGNFIITAVST